MSFQRPSLLELLLLLTPRKFPRVAKCNHSVLPNVSLMLRGAGKGFSTASFLRVERPSFPWRCTECLKAWLCIHSLYLNVHFKRLFSWSLLQNQSFAFLYNSSSFFEAQFQVQSMRTCQNMPQILLPVSWSSWPPLPSCLLDVVKALPGRWWCKQCSSRPSTGPRRFRQLKVACSWKQCDCRKESLHWVQNNDLVFSGVDITVNAPLRSALGPLGQSKS